MIIWPFGSKLLTDEGLESKKTQAGDGMHYLVRRRGIDNGPGSGIEDAERWWQLC
jgi:hypothetical protein